MKKKITKIEPIEEVKVDIKEEVKPSIPFTKRFSYFFDGTRHLIIKDGRIAGEKKCEADAKEFANKFNADQHI